MTQFALLSIEPALINPFYTDLLFFAIKYISVVIQVDLQNSAIPTLKYIVCIVMSVPLYPPLSTPVCCHGCGFTTNYVEINNYN